MNRGSIPGQGTRSHMAQLKVCMLQQRLRTPHAASRPSTAKQVNSIFSILVIEKKEQMTKRSCQGMRTSFSVMRKKKDFKMNHFYSHVNLSAPFWQHIRVIMPTLMVITKNPIIGSLTKCDMSRSLEHVYTSTPFLLFCHCLSS